MITDLLADTIRTALESACAAGDLRVDVASVEIGLDPPRNRAFGDFACNVAMVLARSAGLPPRDVAARIVRHIPVGTSLIDRVEIAGAGFLNFHLCPTWLHDTLGEIVSRDAAYGLNDSHAGQRALIEFVSANPTGPISVVNGRAAALGDTLANLLAACGAEVAREFYVNDALNSTQIDLMGQSLAARYRQLLGFEEAVPDAGYQGEYVVDMARDILAAKGDSLAAAARVELRPLPEGQKRRESVFKTIALQSIIDRQRTDLAAFGVEFNTWFRESSLYADNKVARAIEEIKARGLAYEKDGALWLKTTELTGDDQDRVLVRSNEMETYVAADAAYHKDKFDRGYTHLIDIWGADHHGYVARLKAGIAALGCDPERCKILLTQMVLLVRDGEPVRGSKRAGDIIPLADLVSEVGRDAARFYCLLNSYETTATFDLELAKRQSADNPVFYAQYAHARCCNVLRKAEEMGVIPAGPAVDRSLLGNEKEIDLLRKLAEYPGEVRLAADMLAPHRLAAYIRDLGQALHQFYEECPALKDGVPPDLRDARLQLFDGARIVVRNLLSLFGVSAPDRM